MQFEWDEAKSERNRSKRGFGFAEAARGWIATAGGLGREVLPEKGVIYVAA